MKRFLALALCFALSSLGCSPRPNPGKDEKNEAYTIKLKETPEGGKVLSTKKRVTSRTLKITNASSKSKEAKQQPITEIEEYKDTVLKREGGGRPTKIEREYTKAEVSIGSKVIPSSLNGKTVVIEKKGADYEFNDKSGGKLSPADQQSLASEFSRNSSLDIDKLILPASAVKVGESWKFDMAPVARNLNDNDGIEVEAGASTGKATLMKVYKKDGMQYGVLQARMTFSVNSFGKGADTVKFVPPGTFELDLSLDVAIDGSSETGTMTATSVISGSTPSKENRGSLTLRVNVGLAETKTELK